MSLSSSQQAEKAYKKLQGLALTGTNRFTFNEPFTAPIAIDPLQIWLEQNLIPSTAPSGSNGQVTGVVQKFIDQTLIAVPGTTNSFYHGNLKDSIPHSYGDGVSYNISLKDSTGASISLGQSDWEVDREAGLVTFFGTPPSNMPPKITFFKYVGSKGNAVQYLEEASGSANTYVFASNLNKYTTNLLYIVKPFTTNTGAATININSLGTKAVKKNNDGILADLEADDFKGGINYVLVYDKTNDVFQIASGGGGGSSSIALVPLSLTANTPQSINYVDLKFKDVGPVQFYTQSGNDYELVEIETNINHISKLITVSSLVDVVGLLRISGSGKVSNANGTNSSLAPYLKDLTDVIATTPSAGDTIVYNGTNWINSPTHSSGHYQEIVITSVTTHAINHNLNKYPYLFVIDNTGQVIECSITHIDKNNIQVDFNTPQTGTIVIQSV